MVILPDPACTAGSQFFIHNIIDFFFQRGDIGEGQPVNLYLLQVNRPAYAGCEREKVAIVHAIIGIEKKNGFDGRLRFYGDPECSVEKAFQRLMGIVECAFGKDEDGDALVQKRF